MQAGLAAAAVGAAAPGWAAAADGIPLQTTVLYGAKTITHRALDPINPDLMFGTTGSIWGEAGVGATRVYSTEQAIRHISQVGLQGIEPYAPGIEPYRADPGALKALCAQYGVVFIDCSNGEIGQSTNFVDPAQVPKTIADHVAFCRDFLVPMGSDHWKINMGARPPGGPSDEQLKILSHALNEIGRQTLAMGVRLAPHPHAWGPLEREHEMRRMMELTDPTYVWLTADTAHLTLGGGDPVRIISDYFPRLAEVHLKDTYPKYRGNTQTPTPEMHAQASVYHNLGGGGVDFPAVFQVLRDRHFKGWVVFDVDGPRKGDDGFDAIGGNMKVAVDDYIAHNINYLRDVIGVRFPPLD